jgi:hypothetical protein
MKKLIILLLLSNIAFSQSNFRFNEHEFFTVTACIDPSSSIKEKGLGFVGEIEYAGKIYTKVGFETFRVLTGGYTDIHGAIGLNFTSGYFERIRYYAGVRTAKVWRADTFRIIYGLESGVDYNINDSLFVGLRATYDKRLDQEIFGWKPETKFSGFIRVGYKWYYKNKRP